MAVTETWDKSGAAAKDRLQPPACPGCAHSLALPSTGSFCQGTFLTHITQFLSWSGNRRGVNKKHALVWRLRVRMSWSTSVMWW